MIDKCSKSESGFWKFIPDLTRLNSLGLGSWHDIKADVGFYQCCGSGPGLDPDSIRSVNPEPGGQKWPSKIEKSFMFWSAGGFSCRLDVLYGGLVISKLQFFIFKKMQLYNFYKFFVIKTLDPESGFNESGSATLIFTQMYDYWCCLVWAGRRVTYAITEAGSSRRYSIKLCIWFPSFNFFHSNFSINLMKLINFFLVKRLIMKKGRIISKSFFLKRCFLWSRYGTRIGILTCQKSEPDP